MICQRVRILLALSGLLALSVLARWNLVLHRPLAGYMDNEDAASHILATNIAYSQTPWSVHRFLPIFTLGADHDKNIDDLPTSSVHDKQGNFYYASFPPGAFMLPYLLLPPNPVWLRFFNMLLGVLAAAALGLLAWACSRNLLASGCAAAVYLVAPEALKSHTISFWAHQVYAPLFVVQVYLFVFRRRSIALPLLAFACCLLEWTAYIVAIAMVCVAIWEFSRSHNKEALGLAWRLALSTVTAGLILVSWYALVAPSADYFSALRYRSGVRTATLSGFAMLAGLYAVSLGPFLIPLAASTIARLRCSAGSPWRCESSWLPVFVICIAAWAENLVLTNHANQYSFDRLKGVQLAGLGVAWAVSQLSEAIGRRIFQTTLAAGVASIAMFWWAYDYSQDFQSLEYSMHQRLGEVIRNTAPPDAIVMTNATVRGHTLFYAGRNVVERGRPATSFATVAYDVSVNAVRVRSISGRVPQEVATYRLGKLAPARSRFQELVLIACGKIDPRTVRQTLFGLPG